MRLLRVEMGRKAVHVICEKSVCGIVVMRVHG